MRQNPNIDDAMNAVNQGLLAKFRKIWNALGDDHPYKQNGLLKKLATSADALEILEHMQYVSGAIQKAVKENRAEVLGCAKVQYDNPDAKDVKSRSGYFASMHMKMSQHVLFAMC